MHTVAKFCFNWGIFSMSNSLKKEKVQVALNQGLATLFSQKYLPMNWTSRRPENPRKGFFISKINRSEIKAFIQRLCFTF